MGYESNKNELERKLNTIQQNIVGLKIASVSWDIEYPGQVGSLYLVLENGREINISEGCSFSGCSECNPDGLGSGIHVDLV